MSERAWLESLAADGWSFWTEDGRLRYRAPKAAVVPEVIARLRLARTEVLSLLANDPDALGLSPLSWGQRALWFLWKLAPESTAYHQSMPLDLGPDACAAHWRAAARDVVSRHAMLRTRVRERAGEPAQHVSSIAVVPWEETDATGWTAGRLAVAMRASHERPFALAAAPPIRFHWFSRGAGAVLLVSMHHIACDAWSLELLRRDLAAAAAARSTGGVWEAPPLPHTYTDFVLWQRAMLAGDEGERLWRYWQEALAEPRARLDLPLDRARPSVQSYAGASVEVRVPDDVTAALRALARARNLTLYTVFLAGFLAFLHRCTRQDDLVIGTPTAGRTQPEFAGVVGYFVEPLVLRARVAEGASFDDLLEEARRAVGGAMAHGDFPFPFLVERLNVPRDPARSPVFDVTFNFLSRRAQAVGLGGSEGPPSSLDLEQADGKFDLTLTVIDDDPGVSAAIGYSTSLFEPSTARSFGEALAAVLRAAASDPGASLALLPLDDSAPAPVLTGRVTDTARLLAVHDAIASVAARDPGRVAVIAGADALTYAELIERADGVAAALVAAGAGPGAAVGLRVPRSSDFVVGLLGILRAGAAFVPIEPGQPGALAERMLDRAGAAAVVGLGGVVTPRPSRRREAMATEPLDRMAYVIFTSGSTGEPKGVAVSHRALANYVSSITADLGIDPGASHAFVSTIAADLGHTVIFPALVTGGTLHVFSEEEVTDRDRFAQAIARGIDYLKIVPSHLAALLDERRPALPARAVFLGGEGASADWVRGLAGRSSCRFFNHYGPTETTVGVMTSAFDLAAAPTTATLPLDRAVANTAIWILDEARRSVPRGLPGEVWVSGACLAEGYVGDAERTAERFVDVPGIGRAYRTGDLARALPGGGLLLMGRADRQIKVRGYRVELGQVEAALARQRGVRQAVVLPDVEGPSAAGLLAWIVSSEPSVTAATVRAAAEAALPPYMVPFRVAVVERLPVTPNGKVDVRRLRTDAATESAGVPASRGAARDVLELRLARIWAEALGVRGVGVHDDFFALGGHSLLAVQVASRIHDELGARLPLSAFFTARTVAGLAALVRVSGAGGDRLVPLQARGDSVPLVCFPGAGGGLLYFQHLGAALAPDVPMWGAQAPVSPNKGRDVPGLARMFADALVAEPRLGAPYRLAGHSFGALVAFETACVLRARGGAVDAIAVLDNPAPGAGLTADQADWDDAQWAWHIALRIERLYGVELGVAGAAGGPDWLLDRLLSAGVLPAGTSRDYFRDYVEGYKANVRAAQAYVPAVPIDVPIVVFRAAERDEAIDVATGGAAADLGWGRWTSVGARVLSVPGTHISMLTEPHVRVLARELLSVLAGDTPIHGGGSRVSGDNT